MLNMTIHLPDDVQHNLEWLSRRDNKPMGELITESLRRYLALARLQTPALQALAKAGIELDKDEAMALAVRETRARRSGQ